MVDGTQEDHLLVLETLENLNDAISCDSSKYFALTATACMEEENCSSIEATTSYSAPSCADNAA